MAGKERSPNYPGITLEEAVTLTRALYAKEGRGTVPSAVAFKSMGYKSASGTAKSHLGAMRAYGLIEGSKGNVKISERGLTLMVMPPSAPESVTALREAAIEPPIFRELYETKREASDDLLRHYLVLNRKFREEAADRLIRVYRATLTVAGLDKAGYTPPVKPLTLETQKPGLGDRFVDRETGHVGEYLVRVPLAKGIEATVSIEAEAGKVVRPQHLDRLAEYLKLAKSALETDDGSDSHGAYLCPNCKHPMDESPNGWRCPDCGFTAQARQLADEAPE